jgi:hypothetical protein
MHAQKSNVRMVESRQLSAREESWESVAGREEEGGRMLRELAELRSDAARPTVEKLPVFHLVALPRWSVLYIASNVAFVAMWVACGIALGQQT